MDAGAGGRCKIQFTSRARESHLKKLGIRSDRDSRHDTGSSLKDHELVVVPLQLHGLEISACDGSCIACHGRGAHLNSYCLRGAPLIRSRVFYPHFYIINASLVRDIENLRCNSYPISKWMTDAREAPSFSISCSTTTALLYVELLLLART